MEDTEFSELRPHDPLIISNRPLREHPHPKRKWIMGIGSMLLILPIFIAFLYLNHRVNDRTAMFDQRTKAAIAGVTTTLPSVLLDTGIGNIYTPPCSYEMRQANQCVSSTNNLNVLKISDGTYTIQWKQSIVGDISKSGQDRYELVFSKRIEPIYGLGIQASMQSVAVDDFTDTNFSNGRQPHPKGEITNIDQIANRTPIFILPEKNLIILYIQDEVKQVRLTRTANDTTIVLGKNGKYAQFNTGTLLLVKGSSLADAYSKYHQALVSMGYFFKRPLFKAYGVNWEIYNEMSTYPTLQKIDNAIKKYRQAGITLESMTIGSGYWSYENGEQQASPNYVTGVLCGQGVTSGCGAPAMELLKINNKDFTVLPQNTIGLGDENRDGVINLKDYISKLLYEGIYTVLGMRHSVRTEFTGQFASQFVSLLNQKGFTQYNPANIFLNPYTLYSPGAGGFASIKRILNLNDQNIVSTWVDTMKKVYGDFHGVKEDEMTNVQQPYSWSLVAGSSADTIKYPPNPDNLGDSFLSKGVTPYATAWGGDSIVMASNDYISQASDTVAGNMWIPWYSSNAIRALGKDMYMIKFGLDNALNRVLSGYPNSALVEGYNYITETGSLGGDALKGTCSIIDPKVTSIAESTRQAKEYVRNHQLEAFMPVTWLSCGFWHLLDTGPGVAPRDMNVMKQYAEAAVYYGRLRMRLQQYAYDQAMTYYTTGVPTIMKPLILVDEWKNDPNVQALYKKCAVEDCYPATNPDRLPLDEYMFGNALLIRPILSDKSDHIRVYLPKGIWKSFFKASPVITSKGDSATGYYDLIPDTINQYPAFLKGGELLVIGDQTKTTDLFVYVFLDGLGAGATSSTYTMYSKNVTGDIAKIQLQAYEQNGNVYLKNLSNGKIMKMTNDLFGKGFQQAPVSGVL
jgi:hypothetical protein